MAFYLQTKKEIYALSDTSIRLQILNVNDASGQYSAATITTDGLDKKSFAYKVATPDVTFDVDTLIAYLNTNITYNDTFNKLLGLKKIYVLYILYMYYEGIIGEKDLNIFLELKSDSSRESFLLGFLNTITSSNGAFKVFDNFYTRLSKVTNIADNAFTRRGLDNLSYRNKIANEYVNKMFPYDEKKDSYTSYRLNPKYSTNFNINDFFKTNYSNDNPNLHGFRLNATGTTLGSYVYSDNVHLNFFSLKPIFLNKFSCFYAYQKFEDKKNLKSRGIENYLEKDQDIIYDSIIFEGLTKYYREGFFTDSIAVYPNNNYGKYIHSTDTQNKICIDPRYNSRAVSLYKIFPQDSVQYFATYLSMLWFDFDHVTYYKNRENDKTNSSYGSSLLPTFMLPFVHAQTTKQTSLYYPAGDEYWQNNFKFPNDKVFKLYQQIEMCKYIKNEKLFKIDTCLKENNKFSYPFGTEAFCDNRSEEVRSIALEKIYNATNDSGQTNIAKCYLNNAYFLENLTTRSDVENTTFYNKTNDAWVDDIFSNFNYKGLNIYENTTIKDLYKFITNDNIDYGQSSNETINYNAKAGALKMSKLRIYPYIRLSQYQNESFALKKNKQYLDLCSLAGNMLYGSDYLYRSTYLDTSNSKNSDFFEIFNSTNSDSSYFITNKILPLLDNNFYINGTNIETLDYLIYKLNEDIFTNVLMPIIKQLPYLQHYFNAELQIEEIEKLKASGSDETVFPKFNRDAFVTFIDQFLEMDLIISPHIDESQRQITALNSLFDTLEDMNDFVKKYFTIYDAFVQTDPDKPDHTHIYENQICKICGEAQNSYIPNINTSKYYFQVDSLGHYSYLNKFKNFIENTAGINKEFTSYDAARKFIDNNLETKKNNLSIYFSETALAFYNNITESSNNYLEKFYFLIYLDILNNYIKFLQDDKEEKYFCSVSATTYCLYRAIFILRESLLDFAQIQDMVEQMVTLMPYHPPHITKYIASASSLKSGNIIQKPSITYSNIVNDGANGLNGGITNDKNIGFATMK